MIFSGMQSISSKVGDVGGNKSCPDSPGRSSGAAISPLASKRRVMTGDHVSFQCSTLEYLMYVITSLKTDVPALVLIT